MEPVPAGRFLTAGAAERRGPAGRVVAGAGPAAEAAATVPLLAQGPRGAIVRTRRLLRAAEHAGLEEHMAEEAGRVALPAGAPDGREGAAAPRREEGPIRERNRGGRR